MMQLTGQRNTNSQMRTEEEPRAPLIRLRVVVEFILMTRLLRIDVHARVGINVTTAHASEPSLDGRTYKQQMTFH